MVDDFENKNFKKALFTITKGFIGFSVIGIIATIAINVIGAVVIIGCCWWGYNHVISPSFDTPKLEVH